MKIGNQKEWENFYDSIEGFAYEKGFEYTLEVAETEIENPPADASSVKYILVKQISKTKKKSDNVPTNNIRFTVAAKQVDCQGVGERKCLLVKRGKQVNWESFYKQIEGFTYE